LYLLKLSNTLSKEDSLRVFSPLVVGRHAKPSRVVSETGLGFVKNYFQRLRSLIFWKEILKGERIGKDGESKRKRKR